MTFLLIRTFLGKFIDFFIAHWRVICIGLMLCAIFYYKTCYERTTRELEAFKANIAHLVQVKEAENAQIKKSADIMAKNAHTAYLDEISRHNLDRAKLTKDLANEKDNLNNLLNDAYQLRLNLAGSRTSDKVPTSTELLTESERNRNTIATLVKSCQDTTIAYNSLMQSWIDNCALYGCE